MTEALKIAIVTQYYAPDPPSWIPTGLARELSRRGHHVRVLTTFPHYETGRIAPGHRQRLRHLEWDGLVRVCRVPIIPSHSSNPIGRIANYLSFAFSSRTARSFIRGADVVYVYATPMTPAEGPRAWSGSLGIPFVLHVQDLWPESVTGSGLLPGVVSTAVTKIIDSWLKRVYRSASGVIAIAPTMREVLVARGVPRDRSRVVLNWSNDADDLPGPSAARSTQGLTLVYAGNLGRMQDLETVIRAVHEVRDLGDVTLRIAGSGVVEGELRLLTDQLGATNVEFLGRLGVDEVTRLYREADFQLVTLKDLDIFAGTIPSKLQAGLANSLPVISTVRGDVERMVTNARLGFVAEPGSVESLAEAIRQAHATTRLERDALALRARSFYVEHMSKAAAVDQIELLLASVAKKDPES